MAKQKLLIATGCFLPRWDGIARFLLEIIPKLQEKYEITIVAPDFPGKGPQIEGVHIVRIPLSFLQFGDYPTPKLCFRKLRKLVKQHDIIFSQTIGPIGSAAILAAKKFKKPIVAFTHSIEWELFSKSVKRFGGVIFNLVRWWARWLYNKCTLLIVPASEIIDILESNGIRAEKKVVHLGCDTEKFKPPEMKLKAKKDVGIDPKYAVIGFCGRIGREKDLPTLHKAFKIVGRKRTDILLLIVGTGLKEEEERLFRGRHVMLTGATDNVIPYLHAMDIYVLPSHTETTSLTTLEAMACGLPVIVTRVGYIRRYVRNMKNGLFFEKGNAAELAKKIEELMSRPMLIQRLGYEARETVLKKFSWQETVKGVLAALQEAQVKSSNSLP